MNKLTLNEFKRFVNTPNGLVFKNKRLSGVPLDLFILLLLFFHPVHRFHHKNSTLLKPVLAFFNLKSISNNMLRGTKYYSNKFKNIYGAPCFYFSFLRPILTKLITAKYLFLNKPDPCPKITNVLKRYVTEPLPEIKITGKICLVGLTQSRPKWVFTVNDFLKIAVDSSRTDFGKTPRNSEHFQYLIFKEFLLPVPDIQGPLIIRPCSQRVATRYVFINEGLHRSSLFNRMLYTIFGTDSKLPVKLQKFSLLC